MHCSRVDAFRHWANTIMVERAERGHTELWLTLTSLASAISKSMPSDLIRGWRSGFAGQTTSLVPRSRPNYCGESACRATKVIRHGLCPILKCARVAVNPFAASFAIMSASL